MLGICGIQTINNISALRLPVVQSHEWQFRMASSTTSADCDPSQHKEESAQHRFSRQLQLVSMSVAVLLLGQWSRIQLNRPAAIPLQRSPQNLSTLQIEMNTADWIEWMQLEGIGPALASRIIADRDVNGNFRSHEDLMRVAGIGPATLDRIRPYLKLHDGTLSEISSDDRR